MLYQLFNYHEDQSPKDWEWWSKTEFQAHQAPWPFVSFKRMGRNNSVMSQVRQAKMLWLNTEYFAVSAF